MQFKSLDKKWKEFVFALTGFGPNFMMVLMGAYFTNAINPVALGDGSFQAIMSGVCFISPILFPILYMIARVFDGVVDIPLAHITDSLSTKWGKRRPPIAICILPMILAYAMCWWPVGGASNQMLNTIWIIVWSIVFFATYTMCLVSYYGSLSTTCCDESQRSRVSSYKSFFDTISYCIVYALVPLLLDVFKVKIDTFAFCCLPLMLTMAIPLFMIKEGEKYGYPERQGEKEEKTKMRDSIKLTLKSKSFIGFLLVNACTMFGMQMFLVGMNAIITGGMGFNGTEMAIINTCAFAPVPIMLFLFNKLKAKRGTRLAYQTCLISFAVAIMAFFFASKFMMGDNKLAQFLIAGIGGVCASWAIGAFFMMPFLVPAQVASVEEKITGKNHSAMYFAANSVTAYIAGAIASTLIYENIKMLFINKATGAIVWAQNMDKAVELLGGAGNVTVFNLGTLLIPFVVSIVCFIGFGLAFKMPKDFSPECIAKVLKKQDPSLDITEYLKEQGAKKVDKEEVIFVNVGLCILSGFTFGIIWLIFLGKTIKEFLGKHQTLLAIISCFVPFLGIYYMIKMNKQLQAYAKEKNVELKTHTAWHVVFGIIFPLLFINAVSLAFIQHNVNMIHRAERLNDKSIAEEDEIVAV